MEEKLRAALRSAIAFLEEHGYRYAIIGGIASQYWGRVRSTLDVDIKVLAPHTDYSEAREAIRAAFPERARPELPANPLIVDTKVDDIVVDFLLAIPGYEENIFNRAVLSELDGIRAWICSAEDLIIQKAVANRARDWDDIEGILIEQRVELDQFHIERWLQEFAEALERPAVLDQYHSLVERLANIRK